MQKSTIVKVFLIVGTLVLVFLIWSLVFSENGIVRTGYNAIARQINNIWAGFTGDNKLLAEWDDGAEYDKDSTLNTMNKTMNN